MMTKEPTNIISIRLPEAAAKRAAELARKHDISKSFLLRLGLAAIDAADRAPKGSYLGLTRHRQDLEIVLILPFLEPIGYDEPAAAPERSAWSQDPFSVSPSIPCDE